MWFALRYKWDCCHRKHWRRKKAGRPGKHTRFGAALSGITRQKPPFLAPLPILSKHRLPYTDPVAMGFTTQVSNLRSKGELGSVPKRNLTAKVKPIFDPQTFLAKVGKSRTQVDYRKNQKIFSQGDPAGAIFYIQKGGVKLTVVSKEGKEAVI